MKKEVGRWEVDLEGVMESSEMNVINTFMKLRINKNTI